jgi:hypothetical protein
MKSAKNNRGPSTPSGFPGLIRTYAYTIKRGILNVLILSILCSCSSMKVNGMHVRKREPIRKQELRVYVISFIAGYAATSIWVNR